MIINAFLIIYLCMKLLFGEYKEVDWVIVINYFFSGIVEMIFFDSFIFLEFLK